MPKGKTPKKRVGHRSTKIPKEIDALQKKLSTKAIAPIEGTLRFTRLQLRDIYRLCIAGYTDKELADMFKYSIDQWRAMCTSSDGAYCAELAEAIWRGRDATVARVAASLARRASGWSHKATKFFVVDGKIVAREYVERYPGDVTAQKFYLMNKRPDQWKERQTATIEGDRGVLAPVINIVTSDDKIKQLMKDAEQEANGAAQAGEKEIASE